MNVRSIFFPAVLSVMNQFHLRTIPVLEAIGKILTVEELEICFMKKFDAKYDASLGHAQAGMLKSMALPSFQVRDACFSLLIPPMTDHSICGST